MSKSATSADARVRREPYVKDLVALWQFVRHDPIGRWLGIAWAVVAWFALTWLSLTVTVLLLLVSGALVYVQRRRRDLDLELDELDDLY
jgi:hypothetical protein